MSVSALIDYHENCHSSYSLVKGRHVLPESDHLVGAAAVVVKCIPGGDIGNKVSGMKLLWHLYMLSLFCI